MYIQECIPVGCVPPAAVAVGGGLPQCMLGYTPLVVGLETSPGWGLETPSGQTPKLPPWVWAWKPARHAGIPPPAARHAGIPPAMHAGIQPPVNRILDTRY